MNWYAEKRQEFIGEMLHIYGHINRRHLERKFGCSEIQASKDLKEYKQNNFGEIVYNKTMKRYEKPGFREEEHR